MIWKSILGILVVAIAIVVLAIAIPLASPPNDAVRTDIVIANVNIVDVEEGRIIEGQDVFVRDGTIAQIAPAGTVEASGYTAINGRGRYLMPGLWDMHSHSIQLSPQFHHPLFIANGVTSVRDMSGCMGEPDSFWACTQDRLRWNDRLVNGTGISPRYPLQSSYQMDGGDEVPSGFPDFFRANDVAGITEIVAYYRSDGADFLKTYSDLSVDAYQQLSRAADANGLYIAGHRPIRVSLDQAIDAGQRSIEHPRLFLFECFRGAADFRALPDPLAVYDPDLKRRLIDEHDPAACDALMNRMAESEVYWTPTMQVLSVPARAGDGSLEDDERLRYIPYVLEAGMWQGDVSRALRDGEASDRLTVDQELHALAQENLVAAYEAGVNLLIGTDSGDSYIYPGFAVHDELAAFVEAGIPAEAALRMATIEAARFADANLVNGSIDVGKAADLILLNANPYADIENSRSIEAVVLDGRYLDRDALDELLQFAERQTGSIRFNLQMVWAAIASPLMRVQLAD
ncbi:amidohydrolase family protein [Parasphingopyxis sp. CP4]|uniref:amidohydrolase family protein n=1 Tax=Parasphingopyxis sp. CP4 TaxID=2724527 RepID=UPI0015A03F62|nr:amidohydrolase family protein [Parasphingopyxis sp. CP4]QLC22406.1 amidohydrolase family protein [Parasphingopyxis sp. CP4]